MDEINFDNLKEVTNIYQRQSTANSWGALMKAEWPREHSLISGQVSHHRLSWSLRCPELQEQKESWPGKLARSLDHTAATSS